MTKHLDAEKLTEAQRRMLSVAPADWAGLPSFGDQRPYRPLLRKGFVEQRKTDVTPADWESGGISVVRYEWRITGSGRLALSSASTGKETDHG